MHHMAIFIFKVGEMLCYETPPQNFENKQKITTTKRAKGELRSYQVPSISYNNAIKSFI